MEGVSLEEGCGETVERMLAALRRQELVLRAGIGVGIYRCLHEWPVWFNDEVYHGSAVEFFAGPNFFMFLDIGKVVGLGIYVALCFTVDKSRKSDGLMIAPSLLCAAGFLAPVLFSLGVPVPPIIMLGALFGVGLGVGMLFAQWIEFFGTIPPIKTLQALAFSYVARFLLLPLFDSPDVMTGALGILGMALVSVPVTSWCIQRTATVFPMSRNLPPSGTFVRRNGLLFLFVVLFAFAYGLGSGMTDLSHAPLETGWGKVMPSLIVLLLVLRLGDRFDRTILYALSLPLMLAGLLGVVFLGLPMSVSQVLLSAGFSMFHLLIYVVVCSDAFQSHTSAMPAGACVRALALVAADVAIVLFKALPVGTRPTVVSAVAIVSIGVGFAALMPRFGIEGTRSATDLVRDKRRELEGLAAVHGLSARESTVFELLLEGKTAAQISEELFISNGAVRAHCSRIYDKFGVHSRKDFDALFES